MQLRARGRRALKLVASCLPKGQDARFRLARGPTPCTPAFCSARHGRLMFDRASRLAHLLVLSFGGAPASSLSLVLLLPRSVRRLEPPRSRVGVGGKGSKVEGWKGQGQGHFWEGRGLE